MADVFTASGATLSIAPAVVTTPANAAAYALLTWTAVGMVESLRRVWRCGGYCYRRNAW